MRISVRDTFRDYKPVIFMAVCVVLAVSAAIVNDITFESVYEYIVDNQTRAAIIILSLYALKSVTVVIYYSFLVAVSGFVFDLPVAIAINSVGTLICITVSYLIGYHTKNDAIIDKLNKHKKIKKYFDKCETNSFLVSYILHAMGLSTEVLGLMFGFVKMPYIKYAASSLIAIAPGMICVTIFGRELDFASWEFLIAAAVEVTVIITAYIYSKKKLLKGSN